MGSHGLSDAELASNDWIDEVDESGDKPRPTGRKLNRTTGETREPVAEPAQPAAAPETRYQSDTGA